MQTFRLNKDMQIVAEWKDRRNGFAHEATLVVNGRGVETSRATYINRTWERYEFQSVILSLIRESTYLTKRQKAIHYKRFNK